VLNDRLANDVRRNGTRSSGTDDNRVLVSISNSCPASNETTNLRGDGHTLTISEISSHHRKTCSKHRLLFVSTPGGTGGSSLCASHSPISLSGGWFRVTVSALVTSTKLSYVDPG